MKKNLSLLISLLILLISFSCYGQDSLQIYHLLPAKFPAAMHQHAKTVSAIRWTDNSGEHLVSLEETGNYQNTELQHESDGSAAEIFAQHTCKNGIRSKQIWKLKDYIYDCPVDLEASFMKNMPVVTDLDKDQVPEVWIMYQTVCHGDVSPLTVKIIMYEGSDKYAIRGESKVFGGIDEHGKTHYLGGSYKYDPAFAAQPLFLSYGDLLWKKYVLVE